MCNESSKDVMEAAVDDELIMKEITDDEESMSRHVQQGTRDRESMRYQSAEFFPSTHYFIY